MQASKEGRTHRESNSGLFGRTGLVGFGYALEGDGGGGGGGGDSEAKGMGDIQMDAGISELRFSCSSLDANKKDIGRG